MKLTVLLILLISVGCKVTPTTVGITWHVAKNGSNKYTCTQAQAAATPKQTIAAALACVGTNSAGNAVEVATGTYNEMLVNNNLPLGSSWDLPFTLRAAPGAVVTIKSSGDHNFLLQDTNGRAYYAIISGFTIDGGSLRNTQIAIGGAGYIRFQQNEVINTAAYSAFQTKGTGIEYIRNHVHGGAFLTNPVGLGHAFYVEGSSNLLENNTIHDIIAYGIHVYSDTTPSDNIVRGNYVYNCGTGREAAAGILISGARNTAYNNVVDGCVGSLGNGGVGIDVEGTDSSVYNNTVLNNTWFGINAHGSMTRIQNNIVVDNAENIVDVPSKAPCSYNLTNGTTSSNCTNAISGGKPTFVNARRVSAADSVNPTNPSAVANYRLAEGSNGINDGTPITTVGDDLVGVDRPQGEGYDVGAFEQVAETVKPPDPPEPPASTTLECICKPLEAK